MIRKLPVYIIVDTSYSMRGRPVQQINSGLGELLCNLRKNPMVFEVLHLSIITYNTQAEQVLPLKPIFSVQLPEIKSGGQSNMGAAFELLGDSMRKEIVKGSITKEVKGDWRPVVYVLSDGAPSDAWKARLKIIKKEFNPIMVSFGTADAKMDILETISGKNTVDLNQFEEGINSFIEMVSNSICTMSTSLMNDTQSGSIPVLKFDDEELF